MVSNAPAIIITVVGAVLGLAGGLIGFLALPKIIGNQIEESVKLLEGSDAYKRWETMQIPFVFKIYFFNVSNPQDVQKGAKPVVKEIGPYVYKQYRRNVNVTRKDDVLSYYQHQHFEFDEKASEPLTEADEITIVNLSLMSIATMAAYNPGTFSYQLRVLDSTIPTIFNSPSSIFMTTTPRDFLFDGVYLMCNTSGFLTTIICNMIESQAPAMMSRLEDGRFRFSLYGYKNNTTGSYFSINSGLTDISQLGELLAWYNSHTMDTWTANSTCNKISGSESGIFPPSRSKESVLHKFVTETCRSVSINYSEDVTISGVDLYRYILDENTFASPSNYSKNQCFCLDRTDGIRGDDGCLLDGVIDLLECQGIPVIVSWPHFYLANEIYQNGVDGLKPNKSLHTVFLDLEPMTGSVLRSSNKAQVNIFIRPIEHISLTTDLPTTLMPVLWIDEAFEANDEIFDELNTKMFDVLHVLSIIKWSSIICGVISFIFGLSWVLRSMYGPTEFKKLNDLSFTFT